MISGAFVFFFPCNHIINMKKKSFSGEVIDSVIFPFNFLLHKRMPERMYVCMRVIVCMHACIYMYTQNVYIIYSLYCVDSPKRALETNDHGGEEGHARGAHSRLLPVVRGLCMRTLCGGNRNLEQPVSIDSIVTPLASASMSKYTPNLPECTQTHVACC